MANAIYPTAKAAFLTGGINLGADTIRVALLSAPAAYNAANQFWSSLSAAVVGAPVTLTGITEAGGVFNAANPTFPAVTGANIVAAVIYKDTGTPATSPLIAWLDTTSTGALAITPSGVDITLSWDTGANHIFAL